MKYILIVAALFFCGCKTVKDNAALGRVLANRSLSDSAYSRLEASHPCIIDSNSAFELGATVQTVDTQYVNGDYTNTFDTAHVTDTVKYKCPVQTMLVIKRIVTVDTLFKTLIDTKRINELTANVNTAQGQILQLNTDLAKSTKYKDFWFYACIALVVLFTGYSLIKFAIKSFPNLKL